MTAEQRLFLEDVVLPKLVEMAINDTLPLDMSQLSSYDFEEEAEVFNNSKVDDNMVIKASDYLCEGDEDDDDYMSIEDQVTAIKNHPNKSDMIDWIDGVYPTEAFESTFTVEGFIEQIKQS
jgi:hypothetical protein